MVELLGPLKVTSLEKLIHMAWILEADQIKKITHDSPETVQASHPLKFRQLELTHKIAMLNKGTSEYIDKLKSCRKNQAEEYTLQTHLHEDAAKQGIYIR